MPQPHSEAARIVGEHIRDIRHRFALSQEDVANLSEMHVTNYGKIERGMANPSLTTIVRIATALDTDPVISSAASLATEYQGASTSSQPRTSSENALVDRFAPRRRSTRRHL